MSMNMPFFESDSAMLNKAARIATGDISGNCIPYKSGLLIEEKTCIMAGLNYSMPWVRDTAINTMNAISIMEPVIARDTLLSVCETVDGKKCIGGHQYWDKIIWALGAWQYFSVSLDYVFLPLAKEIIDNSLEQFENEEFDEDCGLFRGPAVYGDGVAAYPDFYTGNDDDPSYIGAWPQAHPDKTVKKGFGISMKTLSTNCVYYAAYRVMAKISEILSLDGSCYTIKADMLKTNINKYFWNEKTGRYDYLFDNYIRCDYSEGIGLAFAMLFGIADREKSRSIISNTYISDQGIPCLWPSFDRYRFGTHYGRHSGTVWPHVQGFWALSMLKNGNTKGFEKELYTLAYRAERDLHFAELYHPETGEIYGGLQERKNSGIDVWKSCLKQTWAATAFWSLLLYGIIGISFTEKEITVKPYLPIGVNHAELKNLKVGKALITITVDRKSNKPNQISLPRNSEGNYTYSLSCGV